MRLKKIPHEDGFASDFQYMARLLKSAISTRRTLFIWRDWRSAYAPRSCQDGWACLWRPISNCGKASGSKQAQKNKVTSFESSLSFGILPKKYRRPDTSSWFDPHEAQSLVVEYTVKRHCTQQTNWGFYYILMLSSGVLFLVQELSLEL
jgi:hypothetical protein